MKSNREQLARLSGSRFGRVACPRSCSGSLLTSKERGQATLPDLELEEDVESLPARP